MLINNFRLIQKVVVVLAGLSVSCQASSTPNCGQWFYDQPWASRFQQILESWNCMNPNPIQQNPIGQTHHNYTDSHELRFDTKHSKLIKTPCQMPDFLAFKSPWISESSDKDSESTKTPSTYDSPKSKTSRSTSSYGIESLSVTSDSSSGKDQREKFCKVNTRLPNVDLSLLTGDSLLVLTSNCRKYCKYNDRENKCSMKSEFQNFNFNQDSLLPRSQSQSGTSYTNGFNRFRLLRSSSDLSDDFSCEKHCVGMPIKQDQFAHISDLIPVPEPKIQNVIAAKPSSMWNFNPVPRNLLGRKSKVKYYFDSSEQSSTSSCSVDKTTVSLNGGLITSFQQASYIRDVDHQCSNRCEVIDGESRCLSKQMQAKRKEYAIMAYENHDEKNQMQNPKKFSLNYVPNQKWDNDDMFCLTQCTIQSQALTTGPSSSSSSTKTSMELVSPSLPAPVIKESVVTYFKQDTCKARHVMYDETLKTANGFLIRSEQCQRFCRFQKDETSMGVGQCKRNSLSTTTNVMAALGLTENFCEKKCTSIKYDQNSPGLPTVPLLIQGLKEKSSEPKASGAWKFSGILTLWTPSTKIYIAEPLPCSAAGTPTRSSSLADSEFQCSSRCSVLQSNGETKCLSRGVQEKRRKAGSKSENQGKSQLPGNSFNERVVRMSEEDMFCLMTCRSNY